MDNANNYTKLFAGLIFFCLILMGLMLLTIKPEYTHRGGVSIFTHPENVGWIEMPTSSNSHSEFPSQYTNG